MNLKQLLKSLGFDDDQVKSIIEGMKSNNLFTCGEENLDIRFDKAKKELEAAKETIKELGKENKENEKLQTQITEYEAKLENLEKEHNSKIKKLIIQAAVKDFLVEADPKFHKLLEKSFDFDSVTIDDKGTLGGFKEQCDTIKGEYEDLFGYNPGAPSLGGKTPPKKTTPPTDKNPFKRGEHFNLTEQGKLFKENPELARQLMAAAK